MPPIPIQVPNRLMFLNTGVFIYGYPNRRTWESNVAYGFVSAGQNPNSSKSLKKLRPGDIVCAYISREGFVGIGTIIDPAVPIGDFLYDGNNLAGLMHINMDPDDGLFANEGEPEFQEYAVRIRWIKTYPRNEAKSLQGLGFHIYPGVCCELRRGRQNDDNIINFIQISFDVTFL
ncbi:MAG TPA: hypothetical protein PKC39_01255 [Ferruginibacter sp.]|nr:hypothetical protein [Ferruginibacter sp.]HMP19560.1 hypothetical protein [Ferruginibacter sp.]